MESLAVLVEKLALGSPRGQEGDLVCFEGEVARIVLHNKNNNVMLEQLMDNSGACFKHAS